MAISNNIYAGSETLWGWSEESTFGTAIADTGNFEMLEMPAPTIDWGISRHIQVKNDGSRVPYDVETYYTDSGGLRVVSFSDMIVRRKDLGPLLYAVCQNVSEAAGTPYKKTYTIDETTTQPLFSNDAGYFATFGAKGPIASYHLKFTSCMLRTLTLNAGDDGRLRASGELISGFANDTTANYNTGTWNYSTTGTNWIDCFSPTLKQIAGSDVVLYDWSVTINNHAVRVGNDSGGDAETYALAMGPEGYEITGSWTVKYDPNVQGLIAACIAGTGQKLELDFGTDGAAGYFGQMYDEVMLENVDRNYETEFGQQIVLPWRATFSTGNDLAVLEVDDALDRAW